MKLLLASKKEIKKAAEKKEDATDWKSNGDLGQCLKCLLPVSPTMDQCCKSEFEDFFYQIKKPLTKGARLHTLALLAGTTIQFWYKGYACLTF